MWIGADNALFATTRCAAIRYKDGRFDLVKTAEPIYRPIAFSPLGNGMFMRNFNTGQTVFTSFTMKKSYPVCNELGPTVAFAHFGHKAVLWKFHLKEQGHPNAYVYNLDRNTVSRILLPPYTVDIMSEANVHKQTSSIYVVTTNKSYQRFILTSVKI